MTTNQRLRLWMAIGALIVVMWFAWAARAGLLPFMLGILLAYLLAPPVKLVAGWISRGEPESPRARAAATLLVYLAIAGVLTGLGFLIVPPVVDNVQRLIDDQEQIIESVREQIDEWLEFYRSQTPDSVQEWIDENLGEAQGAITGWATSFATRSVGVIFSSVSAAIGFFVVPVWLFIIMQDQRSILERIYGLFPEHLRPDAEHVVKDTNRVFGNYLRSLILLGLIVGVVTYIGLWLLDVPYAPALAIIAGVTELIPIIGPIIAAVIAMGVVLAVDPGIAVLWVLLFYIGVQQFENHILVPKIQGDALNVHPALVIVLVLAAGEVFGLLGMALAAPLYAIIRNAFVYTYRRLGGMPRPMNINPLDMNRDNSVSNASPVRDPGDT